MTQSVSSAEVKAAGGLDKWAAKAAQTPPPRTVAKSATVRRLPQARGRRPKNRLVGYDADRMNGLEARYAGRLEAMKRAGQIVFWKFEAVALRLADRTTYNPDFYLMLPDGSVGFHETKGFWRDDARAKIKMAAEQFPELFFVAVQWDGKRKEWRFERFGHGERRKRHEG